MTPKTITTVEIENCKGLNMLPTTLYGIVDNGQSLRLETPLPLIEGDIVSTDSRELVITHLDNRIPTKVPFSQMLPI
jgi:hypothetical protein